MGINHVERRGLFEGDAERLKSEIAYEESRANGSQIETRRLRGIIREMSETNDKIREIIEETENKKKHQSRAIKEIKELLEY
jgi:septal ring factor EnvC (AmiA/AmiB activator)